METDKDVTTVPEWKIHEALDLLAGTLKHTADPSTETRAKAVLKGLTVEQKRSVLDLCYAAATYAPNVEGHEFGEELTN